MHVCFSTTSLPYTKVRTRIPLFSLSDLQFMPIKSLSLTTTHRDLCNSHIQLFEKITLPWTEEVTRCLISNDKYLLAGVINAEPKLNEDIVEKLSGSIEMLILNKIKERRRCPKLGNSKGIYIVY